MGSEDRALLEEYKKLGTPGEVKKALDVAFVLLDKVRTCKSRTCFHETETNLPLLDDFNYYLNNQEDFVSSYNGKIIVLHKRNLMGVYDDDLQAINESVKQGLELGTFLVQKVSPGAQDYTVILSRC